jgi:hypothetical protein
VQRDLGGGVAWTLGKYQITPLASYDIDAVVLSTETYRLGRESDVSPVDFAVAWGSMSDQAIIDQIHFAQGNRFLRFSGAQFPLGVDEINSHVANMHLIPATAEVASQFKTAVRGQIVTMSGYLVRVDAQDGFHWVSSMSRTDRGGGACELMWVERFLVR